VSLQTNRVDSICCALLLLALILGALAQFAFAISGDPSKGKALYETQCLFCHGGQGHGDGVMGKLLTPPPADLVKTQGKSDNELIKIIQNGRPPTAMPGFKAQLSEQDIQDLVAYIKTFGR
jgi:mono/diheme cytochrome c family protein